MPSSERADKGGRAKGATGWRDGAGRGGAARLGSAGGRAAYKGPALDPQGVFLVGVKLLHATVTKTDWSLLSETPLLL